MLLAVDTIPDMFRAPANVTADPAVATMLARATGAPAVAARVVVFRSEDPMSAPRLIEVTLEAHTPIDRERAGSGSEQLVRGRPDADGGD